MINYTREQLNSIDLSEYDKYFKGKTEFYKESGQEHYRLLIEISKDKNLIYDVGTYRGVSAIAFSNAKKVVTYDVANLLEFNLPSNVSYKIGDCLNEDLLKADLIMIDTYHDGTFEKKAFNYLVENNYKGLLMLDDIYLNDEMKSFWDSITLPKQDLTEIGHYTGTGIVYFE